MMRTLLEPLILTVILEAAGAFVIGIRERKNQYLILLTNCITNPILSLITVFFLYKVFSFHTAQYVICLILEPLIVITEGMIYRSKMKTDRNPFVISFILNLTSILGGTLWRMLL